jgi:hypothetical protein
MNTRQSEKNEPVLTARRRRLPVLTILVTVDGFVLGGLVALVLVNRLLADHLTRYAQGNLMAEGSTVLDLMDDVVIYLMGALSGLLVLSSITAVVWAWSRTESQLLRYGAVFLLIAIVLVVGMVWGVGQVTAPPSPSPATPTPVATLGAGRAMNLSFQAISQVWRLV